MPSPLACVLSGRNAAKRKKPRLREERDTAVTTAVPRKDRRPPRPSPSRRAGQSNLLTHRARQLQEGLPRQAALPAGLTRTVKPQTRSRGRLPLLRRAKVRIGSDDLYVECIWGDAPGGSSEMRRHGTKESQCKPVSPAVGCEAREAVGHVVHGTERCVATGRESPSASQ